MHPPQAAHVAQAAGHGGVAEDREGAGLRFVEEPLMRGQGLQGRKARLGPRRQEGEQHVAARRGVEGELWVGGRPGDEPGRILAKLERHGGKLERLSAQVTGRPAAGR